MFFRVVFYFSVKHIVSFSKLPVFFFNTDKQGIEKIDRPMKAWGRNPDKCYVLARLQFSNNPKLACSFMWQKQAIFLKFL